MADALKIEGMTELRKSLNAIEAGSSKALRAVLNDAAEIVVKGARRRAPVKSGKLLKTIKVSSTQTTAKVAEGSKTVPYAGFIDFGGKTGRKKSVHRPFLKDGRIVYPAYYAQKQNIQKLLQTRLDQLIKDSGLTPS